MSAPENKKSAGQIAKGDHSAREAITFYNPLEEREPEKAPLQWPLIRRIFRYTKPYAAKRNWLFVFTFIRGLQIPALAWLIGRTINGPISHRDLSQIYFYAAAYFALALVTAVNFHFRQRFALELGEAVVHDMRTELFAKLMIMPMAFFNATKFGRIISRLTSDIDSVRAGVQDVAFVLVVQGLQMIASRAERSLEGAEFLVSLGALITLSRNFLQPGFDFHLEFVLRFHPVFKQAAAGVCFLTSLDVPDNVASPSDRFVPELPADNVFRSSPARPREFVQTRREQ